jgi:ammonia channel protein AmtB
VLDPKHAPIVGFATGVLYVRVSNLMIYLEIDDPVDAAAVHITGGVTGLLAVAIFADGGQLLSLYGTGEVCGV